MSSDDIRSAMNLTVLLIGRSMHVIFGLLVSLKVICDLKTPFALRKFLSLKDGAYDNR